MLEVCIDSLESAINAIHGGADELEVCSSLPEGGLTPSAGLVREILSMVSRVGTGSTVHRTCNESCDCKRLLLRKPKVNVMIRCRTGSDFCYNEQEMDTMIADVEIFKQMNVDRIVFGALTKDKEIDEINCAKVIIKAFPTPTTFHRAFDMCKDPILSIQQINELGFYRLLTSGQRETAAVFEAIELIKDLQKSFGDKIEIMPGAGVNVENAKLFVDLGCKIVHSSCKVTKTLPKVGNQLNMGTGDSEYLFVTDKNIVQKMKQVLKV